MPPRSSPDASQATDAKSTLTSLLEDLPLVVWTMLELCLVLAIGIVMSMAIAAAAFGVYCIVTIHVPRVLDKARGWNARRDGWREIDVTELDGLDGEVEEGGRSSGGSGTVFEDGDGAKGLG